MPRRPRPRQRQPRTDDRRPAHLRGYDSEWSRLARAFRRRHPLCCHCLAKGITRPAALVDHIVPITGPHDAGRLDESNLQALCRSCHTMKTAREGGEVRSGPAAIAAPPAIL